MQVRPNQLIFTDHAIKRYADRILPIKMDQDRIVKEISNAGIRKTGYLKDASIVSKEKKPKWVRGSRKVSHYLILSKGNIVCPVVREEDQDKWIVLTTLHKSLSRKKS